MEMKRKSLVTKVDEIKIDPNMPDYSDDPFFMEKKRKMIEFLKEHPIPKRIVGKL